ncbi:MAG: ABC transporter substrate-binding protein [Mariprofundaceae bacterium]
MNKIMKAVWLLILMSMSLPVWAADEIADVGPKAVVEQAVNGILNALEQRSDSTKLTEEDRQAIRLEVKDRFDYAEMARRSVGKLWKKQSSEKQAQFTETFRDLLEYSYGNRLAAYRGQKVQFDEAEFKKKKARVKTWVIDANKKTPVEYRLHHKDQSWKVYDIKIEGVSLVGTFRKDFKGSLKKQGFDGLLSLLQDKVKRLKAKDAA